MPLVSMSGPGSRLYTSASEPEPEEFDFYISPTGNDANAGTEGWPWAITAINTHDDDIAGMRVGLLDGTYDLTGMDTWNSDTPGPHSVLNVPSGTEGSPTVIQAVNARQAILSLGTGGSRLAIPAIGQFDGDWCTIKNIAITGGGQFQISFYQNAAGYSVGQRVEGCSLTGLLYLGSPDNAPAIYSVANDGLYVGNCKFDDIYQDQGATQGACAVLDFGSKNTVFEYNEVSNTNCAIYCKHNVGGRTTPGEGYVVRFNYIHHIEQVVYHGFDNQYAAQVTGGPFLAHLFHHNIYHDCGGYLDPQVNEPPNSAMKHYNETYHQNIATVQGCIAMMVCASTSVRRDWYNNILQRTVADVENGDVAFSTGGLGVVDYNCYSSDRISGSIGSPINTYSGATTFTKQSSLANWRTASGKEAASGQADASFAMTGTGVDRYKLGGSSPCLAGGARTGKVGGVSGGANCDAGAWEGGGQRGCDW